AERVGGGFGRDGVRDDPGRPLHAELLTDQWDDLPVPVVVGLPAAIERAGVERDAVGRIVEKAAKTSDQVDEERGELGERLAADRPEVRGVDRREDPGFVRMLRRVRREGDASRTLCNHPGPEVELLGELVAERAALLLAVVALGARQLLLDALRGERRRDD